MELSKLLVKEINSQYRYKDNKKKSTSVPCHWNKQHSYLKKIINPIFKNYLKI